MLHEVKKGPFTLTPRDLVREIPSALIYPLAGRGVLAIADYLSTAADSRRDKWQRSV